jgi:hypothetical protein
VLVLGVYADVYRALHVHGHSGNREAPLLAGLDVVAGPLDLRIGERDQRRVRSDAIDEQALRDPELGRREADADGVLHDRGHPADLGAQRIVEAIDRGCARLEHRVPELAYQGHRRHAARFDLRIERGNLVVLWGRHLGVLGFWITLLAHRRRV